MLAMGPGALAFTVTLKLSASPLARPPTEVRVKVTVLVVVL